MLTAGQPVHDDNRIVIPSAHGAKPKKINVKAYNVGYYIGERFESQLKKHNSVSVSHIGSGTGSSNALMCDEHIGIITGPVLA